MCLSYHCFLGLKTIGSSPRDLCLALFAVLFLFPVLMWASGPIFSLQLRSIVHTKSSWLCWTVWGAGVAAAPRWRPGWLPGLMTCAWLPHYLRLSHIPLCRHHASSARLRCRHLLWTNGLLLRDWGDWEESVGYLRHAPWLFGGFPFLHCNVKCSWINLLEEGQRGVASFLLAGVDVTLPKTCLHWVLAPT